MTLGPGDPFRCGHPRTPDNAYESKKKATPDRSARSYLVCKTCRDAKTAAYRDTAHYKAKSAQWSRAARARKRTAPDPSTVVLPHLGPWVRDSLCSTPMAYPQDFWFSDKRMDQNRAANFCLDCPVMFECAQYAVDNKIEHGVWGGLTPSDRGHTRGRP